MTGMDLGRMATVAAGVLATGVVWGDVPGRPTYTRDVAPILNANCVQCHRPGESAPMSLLSYDEVRPWAKAIQKNVSEGVMPPWHADPNPTHTFANDRSLSDDEIKTIVKWVEQGAKQGDPKDMPALPEFSDGEWRLGEPDLVVMFDKVDLPAGGPDQFYDLPHQLNMPEDRWLKAVEVRPSNRKVTHHVIVYQTEGNAPPQGWLSAWAAGTDPMVFPEKTGRLLKKNAMITGDMHYHPADEPQSDQTSLGLYFAEDDAIEKEVINLWIANQNFEIPAGNPSYKARSTFIFQQDSQILSFLPHMHYRGKTFTYNAKYPDGRTETLMSVSDYDFNWQTQYLLENPIYVPKGTRIDCIAEWDNSTNNPRNPDPTKTVRNGDESFDEMMIGFVDYIVVDGVRPVSPTEMIAEKLKGLTAEHPGDTYKADLYDEDDNEEFAPGGLYLPREGVGLWHVAAMGSIYEARVTDIVWTGDDVTATVAIAGLGNFQFTATLNQATGEMNGRLQIPNSDDFSMDVRAKRID